jgi:hypothetical protein
MIAMVVEAETTVNQQSLIIALSRKISSSSLAGEEKVVASTWSLFKALVNCSLIIIRLLVV